jgi:phosphatidylinositol-3-phosphatase
VRRLILLFGAALLLLADGAQARPAVPSFRHVVMIMFENKEQASVIGSSEAPTFNEMAAKYAVFTQYYGITHRSLPNYLALISGSTQGIHEDCTTCSFAARNLADTLPRSHKTWKAYAEGLPQRGFTGASSGFYAKKHVPFLYFRDVISRRARLNRVVPLQELPVDLRRRRLPDFALIVPDMCNSMHDCPVSTGDAWLRRQLPPLLSLPKTVVFVLFDEGETNEHGGGHIPALALGTAVRPHSRVEKVTDHYSLLRTIEDGWKLPRLGASAQASPITGIWR